MRRDARKNEDFVATLREHKLAEFHQGKILLDARGNRVRVESFFLRPQANQFKLVVLNSRKDRFDYFFYKGTFNKSLPDDLSLAFNDLAGGLGAQPGFYLTGYETGRSNLTDTIYEIAQGGHLVDVNNNADGGDDITSFFNAGTDSFLDAAGRSVFLTLYDRFGLYLNGKLKRGWTGNNLQTYGDAVGSSTTDPISGAVLTASNAYLELSSNLAARTVNTTFPNASDVHQRVFESYSDGAHLTWDNFAINDRGDVAPVSDFAGRTSGSAYQRALLNFNYEQVITATEFQGRKIDLIIGPRLLIQAGLIQ
jgi:hypothetical protein